MKTAEEAVAEVLEHHGVKGMKWGVRKARDTVAAGGKSVAKGASKVNTARKDAKFRRQRNSGRTVIMLVNAAAVNTKKDDLPRINAKYKGQAKTSNEVSLYSPSRVPAQRAYRKEVAQAYRKNLEKAANATTNASGTRRYEIRDKIGAKKGAPVRWKVRTRKIEHAGLEHAGTLDEFTIEPVFDAQGFITDFKLVDDVEDSMAQAEEFLTDFLEHHGVKGMKWGVRRDKVTATGTQARTVTDKAKVKTSGGTGQNAHPDAVKVAKKKQTIKKSGTAALSNKDLQEVIERARLETQAREAVAGRGKKFIKKKLGTQLDQQTNQFVQQQIRDASKRRGGH